MADSHYDINRWSYVERLQWWINRNLIQDEFMSSTYHPKYKGFDHLWLFRNRYLAKKKLDDIQRRYKGRSTSQDFFQDNKLRLALLNLSEMTTLVQKESTNEFSRFFRNKARFARIYLQQGFTTFFTFHLSSKIAQDSRTPFLNFSVAYTGLTTLLYPLQFHIY